MEKVLVDKKLVEEAMTLLRRAGTRALYDHERWNVELKLGKILNQNDNKQNGKKALLSRV